MVPPAPISAEHHRHFRAQLLISLLFAFLMIGIILIAQSRAPKKVIKKTQTSVAQTIQTPQTFTDFVGKVTKVDGVTLSVDYGLVGVDGKVSARTYTVTVDAKTILREQVATDTGADLKPIAVKDFAVGQRVHCYGDHNLYPVTSFTATSLYIIRQTP